MCKIFSLKKTCRQRKLRQTKRLLFNFWMTNWSKHQFCQIAKRQVALIGINVNSIIQKLKSKHLVCSSFLWWQFFLREREKRFHTYSGPRPGSIKTRFVCKLVLKSNCQELSSKEKGCLMTWISFDIGQNRKHNYFGKNKKFYF